jgi:transcriptional regulator with XRE-family HTH domain
MTSITGQDPLVARHRLVRAVRRAREEAGLTLKQVADALDWSESKLIRIERGSVGISVTDLRALLAYYGLRDTSHVDRLIGMARSARRVRTSWAEFESAVSPGFLLFLGYEESASTMLHFNPALVPGLLQVEDYSRAVLDGAYVLPADHVEEKLRARLRRQRRLEEADPPTVDVVLDESVVRRSVGGPEVMVRQLQHLHEVAGRPNVSLRIVPFGAGLHPGMGGPFVILEFDDPAADPVLHLETAAADVTLRDQPAVVEPYREAFTRLQSLAMDPEATRAFLLKVLDEMWGPRSIPSPGVSPESRR